MRRCRTALLSCFVGLACLAATPSLAGEIVDEPAQEMIEGLLKDLAKLRTPGRGASGTLRTLLSSSDSVICGFWQMKQHALMNELAMKDVPAEVYRKAQRLGERIDRNCDRVINPEAYRNGGAGTPGGAADADAEEDEGSGSDGGDSEPLDPKTRCENECLPLYLKWKELERDVTRWKQWQKRREAQLEQARAENRRAAEASRAADRRSREAAATARKQKGEAEAAGWPSGSGNHVGEALQERERAKAAARRAKERWREAYAEIARAKQRAARAKEMVAYFQKWAAQARAAYEACVKRCEDAVAMSQEPVSLETLRRFQTDTASDASMLRTAPILVTPGSRRGALGRAIAPMSPGYARHVTGWRAPQPEGPRSEVGQRWEETAVEAQEEHTMRAVEDRITPEMQQTEVAPLVVEAGARM